MLIGMKPNSVRTQPLAPGAANELSTEVPFLAFWISFSGSNSRNGSFPVIGLFGGGGAVVPVVRLRTIGAAVEPTQTFLPKTPVEFSRCTLTGGRANAGPAMIGVPASSVVA